MSSASLPASSSIVITGPLRVQKARREIVLLVVARLGSEGEDVLAFFFFFFGFPRFRSCSRWSDPHPVVQAVLALTLEPPPFTVRADEQRGVSRISAAARPRSKNNVWLWGTSRCGRIGDHPRPTIGSGRSRFAHTRGPAGDPRPRASHCPDPPGKRVEVVDPRTLVAVDRLDHHRLVRRRRARRHRSGELRTIARRYGRPLTRRSHGFARKHPALERDGLPPGSTPSSSTSARRQQILAQRVPAPPLTGVGEISRRCAPSSSGSSSTAARATSGAPTRSPRPRGLRSARRARGHSDRQPLPPGRRPVGIALLRAAARPPHRPPPPGAPGAAGPRRSARGGGPLELVDIHESGSRSREPVGAFGREQAARRPRPAGPAPRAHARRRPEGGARRGPELSGQKTSKSSSSGTGSSRLAQESRTSRCGEPPLPCRLARHPGAPAQLEAAKIRNESGGGSRWQDGRGGRAARATPDSGPRRILGPADTRGSTGGDIDGAPRARTPARVPRNGQRGRPAGTPALRPPRSPRPRPARLLERRPQQGRSSRGHSRRTRWRAWSPASSQRTDEHRPRSLPRPRRAAASRWTARGARRRKPARRGAERALEASSAPAAGRARQHGREQGGAPQTFERGSALPRWRGPARAAAQAWRRRRAARPPSRARPPAPSAPAAPDIGQVDIRSSASESRQRARAPSDRPPGSAPGADPAAQPGPAGRTSARAAASSAPHPPRARRWMPT